MPVEKYNRYFGGMKGSAGKARGAMLKHYGVKEGERIFYATKNKRQSQGKGAGVMGAVKKRKQERRTQRR
jgi:hypothetical protein